MSGGERTASPHESAALHVTGEARYVDDIPVPLGSLFVSVKGADITAGELVSMDLTQVSESPGVVCVLTAESVPGSNDVSPVYDGDVLFVERDISFHDQPLEVPEASTSNSSASSASLIALMRCPCLDIQRQRTLQTAMMACIHCAWLRI